MPASAADGSAAATSSFLRIHLRPSRILAGYLVSVHALAVVAMFFTSLPTWGGILAAVVLLISLLHSYRRHHWQGERALLYSDGNWKLVDDSGEQDLELAGESYIHPWLTILRFRTLVLPLLPDSASPTQLQALRRILRFGMDSVELSRR